MKEKFSFKETLKRNWGLLIRYISAIILFLFGIGAISKSPDGTTVLFLTLGWCYVFFKELKFFPRVIYKDEKGNLIQY